MVNFGKVSVKFCRSELAKRLGAQEPCAALASHWQHVLENRALPEAVVLTHVRHGSTKDSACWFLPSTINHQPSTSCGLRQPCAAFASRWQHVLENGAPPETLFLTHVRHASTEDSGCWFRPHVSFPSQPSTISHQPSTRRVDRFDPDSSRDRVLGPRVLDPSSPPHPPNFILCRFMWLHVA